MASQLTSIKSRASSKQAASVTSRLLPRTVARERSATVPSDTGEKGCLLTAGEDDRPSLVNEQGDTGGSRGLRPPITCPAWTSLAVMRTRVPTRPTPPLCCYAAAFAIKETAGARSGHKGCGVKVPSNDGSNPKKSTNPKPPVPAAVSDRQAPHARRHRPRARAAAARARRR